MPDEIMPDDVAISLKNVSKVFNRYHHPIDRLKDLLLPGKQRAEAFWALENIDLEIPKGDTFGIVGRNGSGKSTLLQIIAGTLQPTTGQVDVKGRVSALLELGSGFNPEFTGAQNIFFNGRILGLSRAEIESKFDAIAAFADIGTVIDQPVKTYSSGRFVRFGFSVAIHVDPEIFIVDEALAVGDMFFQHRCMRKIQQLMDAGATTLFVSHDAGAVKSLCNWAVLLHDGKVKDLDTPSAVLSRYARLLTELEIEQQSQREIDADAASQLAPGAAERIAENAVEKTLETRAEAAMSIGEQPNESERRMAIRRGDKRIEIEKVSLLGASRDFENNPVFSFDQEVCLSIRLVSYSALKNCIVGYFVCDKNGIEILGTNTEEEGVAIQNVEAGCRFSVDYRFRLPLRTGTYSITVAVTEDQTAVMSDWIDNAIVFQLLPPESDKNVCGMVSIPVDITVLR